MIVSKAVLGPNKTSIEISLSSNTLKRSFITLSNAAVIAFSRIFVRKGRLDIGL